MLISYPLIDPYLLSYLALLHVFCWSKLSLSPLISVIQGLPPLLILLLYLIHLILFPVKLSPLYLLQTTWESPLSTSSLLLSKGPRQCRRTVWCYHLGDFAKASELLANVDWDQLTNEPDVDQCWQTWQSTFLHIISACIPKKALPRRRNLPWIDSCTLQAFKRRNSLLKAYKRSGSPLKFLQYKHARNRIVSKMREAKHLYFQRLQSVDDKTFWKLFKMLTRKDSSIPTLVVPNSGTVTNDTQKADILNNQFFSNFNHSVPSLSPCDVRDICNFVPLDMFNIPEEFLCTEIQVLDLIRSLDSTKSTGADGISARMLKATALSISKSLSVLFNKSITTGKFPTHWKFARVVPIPKRGCSTNPANYRPISILPVLSKLLEKHIYNLLRIHLNTTSPLSQHQWGFTSGRSTTTALLSFTHYCQSALDCGGEVCSVFFDLSKAFDKVPHLPLLRKLVKLQVKPFILRWIGSYLLDRTQSVVLGGAQSSPLHALSGVPQGSVLGPLLFLVYIDGVSGTVPNSNIAMYADDIALYKLIRNPRDYTVFQNNITSLCNWVSDNDLVLNLGKCSYIIFSRKHTPTVPSSELCIGDSHPLTRCYRYKYLGVTFSSDLSWSLHISNVCKRTRKHIGMLYRNFYRFADSPTLLKLYILLVRPHTEYACILWDPHLAKDILAVEKPQKFALRVCCKDWQANYDLLLSRCGISHLSSRRQFLTLCMLFNIFKDLIAYPCSPLSRRISPYPNNLPNPSQLATIHARLNIFKYSFFPSAIVAWNSLDFDTSNIHTLLSFKHALHNN